MAPILGGNSAWTSNKLNGFGTVGVPTTGQRAVPYNMMNGEDVVSGAGGLGRPPFGGYYVGLAVFVKNNDHVLGDHEISFFKITKASGYVGEELNTSVRVTIPPLFTGYFWSNAETNRSTRFFRKDDNIGVTVRKISGSSATGISDVTITAVYDFVDNL